jgi:hypothetical protein
MYYHGRPSTKDADYQSRHGKVAFGKGCNENLHNGM